MRKKEKVIVYIDGFNLYYGLREAGYRRYYWLNLQKLAQNLLKPHQELLFVKYFTTRISWPPAKVKRQNDFLEALGTLSNFQIYYGHYLKKWAECKKCGNRWPAFEEKMTDVNIATEMIFDALDNNYDTAFLISADSDLVPPVERIRDQAPEKRIIALFPPKRKSGHLKRTVHASMDIGRAMLAKSQFPDEIKKPDGYILRRPCEWK